MPVSVAEYKLAGVMEWCVTCALNRVDACIAPSCAASTRHACGAFAVKVKQLKQFPRVQFMVRTVSRMVNAATASMSS